jgi:hypothetical protein
MSESVHTLYLPCTYLFAKMLHESRKITKDYKTRETQKTPANIDQNRYPKNGEEKRKTTEKAVRSTSK